MEAGSAWIRINVRGREAQGIVEPGREYDEVCGELTAELLRCRDAATGEPAIMQVARREEIVRGPRAETLPDLWIRFNRDVVVRTLTHPTAGTIEDSGDGWRATEHNSRGWLTLRGPGVRAMPDLADGRAEDMAPTLMHLLGAAVPDDMEGRVLEEMLGDDLGPVRTTTVDAEDDAWAAVAR
jgi:predicted AlkP superfamily phosphohydrolase/phosphomutase